MPRKRKPTNLNTFVKTALRKASLRWPPRYEALVLSRKERGRYQCAHCQELFHKDQVQVDHVQPVIDPRTGFTTWDEYVTRLLCSVDNLNVLCSSCHDLKTEQEDYMREFYKTKRDEKVHIPKKVDKKKSK